MNNKSTLKLTFADKAIEKDFEEKQLAINTLLLRFALLIATALYSCFYFILLPLQVVNYQADFLPIYQVVLLNCTLFYGLSYSKHYAKHHLTYNTLSLIIIAGGVSLAMYTIHPLSATLLHSAGLPLAAFFILFGISWLRAFILALVYSGISLVVILSLSQPFLDFSFGLFNLFGFFVIASIAGFLIEKQKRQAYLAEQKTERLIKDLEQSKRTLHELSIKDGLTGLFNRRHFDDIGALKINETKRLESNMHLLVLDIDYFKQYNDHYGHPAGDEVLTSISNTLLKTLRRSTDLIFRIGGEEFAVILLGDPLENRKNITQSIHSAINALEIPHSDSLVEKYITISIGIASVDASTNEPFEDLYNKADKALYLAKNSGRNQTVIY